MSTSKDTMNLKQEIAAWDRKSADDICDIYDRYCHASSFVSEVLRLAKQEQLQKGTTWLLNQHLEKIGYLETPEVKDICRLLPKLEHWETKLHVLQCIPYISITKPHKKKVETFLKKCLVDDAKLVRAWAYSKFYELAVQYPEYQEEAKQLFEEAMRDEAASVKARIRRIIKKGFG